MVDLRDVTYGLGTGTKAFNHNIMKHAFKKKVKLIDCGNLYPTQRNIVGPVIKDLTKQGTFNRDSVFIVSKLWVNELGKVRKFDYETWDPSIENHCKKALNQLGITYLDALLIHWPLCEDKDSITDEFIIEEIWPQMEQLVKKKLVRYIGVSNFGLIELHKLLNICNIYPYINELEINPYQTNQVVTQFCLENNIRVLASSPFSFGWKDNHLKLFKEPKLINIANKHNISPAAVVVKWLIDQDIIPIPGTSNPNHWDEYEKLDAIMLDGHDVLEIESLHKNLRLYDDRLYRKHRMQYIPHYSYNVFEALVGTSTNPELNPVRTDKIDFLEKCKISLTSGPGYLVLRKIFVNELNTIMSNFDGKYNKQNHGRHDGADPRNWKDAIINQHPVYSTLMNNNIIGLIVESLLGWDCLIDNCAFTTSRPSPHSHVFGPHQDSPFEQRPGAMLPHYDSPVVIQAIFCIDGFSEENGGLFALPYTHKNRKRPNLPHHGDLRRGIIPKEAIALDTEPGDVILALGNVWHGAYANKTSIERRAFLTEYINSIVEPRDKFNASNINKDIYKTFSKRLVRLFSNRGKERLAQPWLEHQQK
jgi:diketogulonate reductase-like aldo/keto reductase/ectoine hydroxylase-related dioxygenase (phytanoyl-CoA dioxygenase family)